MKRVESAWYDERWHSAGVMLRFITADIWSPTRPHLSWRPRRQLRSFANALVVIAVGVGRHVDRNRLYYRTPPVVCRLTCSAFYVNAFLWLSSAVNRSKLKQYVRYVHFYRSNTCIGLHRTIDVRNNTSSSSSSSPVWFWHLPILFHLFLCSSVPQYCSTPICLVTCGHAIRHFGKWSLTSG